MLQRSPRFTHTSTAQLYEYWNRQRGDRSAPSRSQIEPSDIRTILPDTFILSAEEHGRFSWRLAGTRVCTLYCRELKERNFLSDWLGRERETIASLLQAVVEEAAVCVLQFQGSALHNQTLTMEMVLMPLSLQTKGHARVLGAIAALDTPYWLGIQPPQDRKIGNTRLVWPSGPPQGHFGTVPTINPGANIILPFPPAVESFARDQTRRYRHLTVVDGGKA